ncbi:MULTISPECIES: hypothetical protein [unclassified Mesorhizobium]|uniref:hypothetical protein n=1 Tax=unclassified Mesorhizobium TaxID=325217 RepID=UPI000BB0AF90|nr:MULTISPECIES: hypothetical protein [unclassified Mesorhizobium]TGT60950.1 hypothetical protein EN813_018410 [Mesorhizobium sp. M00.F.Ca.ET.170.01.1.1]AZO08716.1 hypothetical protein EJ074_06020 [Mesorhizobium sp. M3A.F.Ca.ET.080.04.2.1]PBB84133.1 hypothetical protein CK216_25530 [Mesorhizobium sp. WSM3876]RWB72159.1 MAG: hypothetical protein EOQ49_13035 [Mesorhizobium sp.]RWB83635.1 MAG: hypothetical protein EOQ52_25845 [Mesorhizobium sp.]
MHHPHVESPDIAKNVDQLLAEHRTGLLSMKDAIALLRQRTGTERSDADLAALITKKAAHLGVAVVSNDR